MLDADIPYFTEGLMQTGELQPDDGRRRRTATTKAKLIRACKDGILAGRPPKAEDIATRENVSVRSVFQHFASLDQLYKAAIADYPQIVAFVQDRFEPYLTREDLGMHLTNLFLHHKLPPIISVKEG